MFQPTVSMFPCRVAAGHFERLVLDLRLRFPAVCPHALRVHSSGLSFCWRVAGKDHRPQTSRKLCTLALSRLPCLLSLPSQLGKSSDSTQTPTLILGGYYGVGFRLLSADLPSSCSDPDTLQALTPNPKTHTPPPKKKEE